MQTYPDALDAYRHMDPKTRSFVASRHYHKSMAVPAKEAASRYQELFAEAVEDEIAGRPLP